MSLQLLINHEIKPNVVLFVVLNSLDEPHEI